MLATRFMRQRSRSPTKSADWANSSTWIRRGNVVAVPGQEAEPVSTLLAARQSVRRSCLPKDVRALNHFSRQQGVLLPLLENILASNEQQLRSLLQRIERSGQSEVVILGLSFKADTDDLRESAMVEVAQSLLGRGYQCAFTIRN